MPRKYEKKTKDNFRGGRQRTRRASLRVNMVPPGFSMFDDDYSSSIDETMLLLRAKGMDRERERFAEALSEVQDRIAKIIEDYDSMIDEGSLVFMDYIDELEEQVALLPIGKLKQNIMRILADFNIVCEEKHELLAVVNESLQARTLNLFEINDDEEEDEFEIDESEINLRNYVKTINWLSNKFRDMDARFHMMKKQETTKGEKKGRKKKGGLQVTTAKNAEITVEKPVETTNSRERLETWKHAADEIVELLHTVRQEGEGGKEALEFELQKIMTIMKNQNEEIMKKKKMLQEEKDANMRLKQNYEKLLAQNKGLENKLVEKRSEVSKCKQYIREMSKTLKESGGEMHIAFEDEGSDSNDELSNVMRRRFTLTDASQDKAGLAQLRLKDAQRRANDLEEDKMLLEKKVENLGAALVQKDKEISDLKANFGGYNQTCKKCMKSDSVTSTENDSDRIAEENDAFQILVEELKESESALESTRVELMRMKQNFEEAGKELKTYKNKTMQTMPQLQLEGGLKERIRADVKSKQGDESRSGSKRRKKVHKVKTPLKPKSRVDEVKSREKEMSGLKEHGDDSFTQEDNLNLDETLDKNHDRIDRKLSTSAAMEEGDAHEDEGDDYEEASYEELSDSEESQHDSDDDDYYYQENVNAEDKAVQTSYHDIGGGYTLGTAKSKSFCDIMRSKFQDGDLNIDPRDGGFVNDWEKQLKELGSNIKDVLGKNKPFTDVTVSADGSAKTTIRFEEKDTVEHIDEYGERMKIKDDALNEIALQQKFQSQKRRKTIFQRLVENSNQKKRDSLKIEHHQNLLTQHRQSIQRDIKKDWKVNNLEFMGKGDSELPLPRLPKLTNSLRSIHKITSSTNVTKQKTEGDPISTPNDATKLPNLLKQENESKKHVDEPSELFVTENTIKRPESKIKLPNVSRSMADINPEVAEVENKEVHVKKSAKREKTEEPTSNKELPEGPEQISQRKVSKVGQNSLDSPSPSIETEDHNNMAPIKTKNTKRGSIKFFEFPGEEAGNKITNASGFKVRRKSIFGHCDIMDILSAGAEDTKGRRGTAGDVPNLFDTMQNFDSFARSGVERDVGSKDIFDESFSPQSRKLSKINRGVYRPSLHRFIGVTQERRMTLEDSQSFSFQPGDYDFNDDEETDIEIGPLMSGFRMNNLRRALLRLGILHLNVEMGGIMPNEKLTMEDQINIIAQTTIEVLKRIYNAFKHEKKPLETDDNFISEPSLSPEQYSDNHYSDLFSEKLPPVKSPDFKRLQFEERSPDSNLEENKIFLPKLVQKEVSDRRDSSEKKFRPKRSEWPNNKRDDRAQSFLAQLASRRPHRPHGPGRNVPRPRNLVEKILATRVSTGVDLKTERPAVRRPSLFHRPTFNVNRESNVEAGNFAITAQAIKLPRTTNLQHPRQEKTTKMPKSTSLLSREINRRSFGPVINKAKSDPTHYGLMLKAGGAGNRMMIKSNRNK